MVLIPCPECNKQVSTLAASCPNCGAPIGLEKKPVYGEGLQMKVCGGCHQKIPAEEAICPLCGYHIITWIQHKPPKEPSSAWGTFSAVIAIVEGSWILIILGGIILAVIIGSYF